MGEENRHQYIHEAMGITADREEKIRGLFNEIVHRHDNIAEAIADIRNQSGLNDTEKYYLVFTYGRVIEDSKCEQKCMSVLLGGLGGKGTSV